MNTDYNRSINEELLGGALASLIFSKAKKMGSQFERLSSRKQTNKEKKKTKKTLHIQTNSPSVARSTQWRVLLMRWRNFTQEFKNIIKFVLLVVNGNSDINSLLYCFQVILQWCNRQDVPFSIVGRMDYEFVRFFMSFTQRVLGVLQFFLKPPIDYNKRKRPLIP